MGFTVRLQQRIYPNIRLQQLVTKQGRRNTFSQTCFAELIDFVFNVYGKLPLNNILMRFQKKSI